MARHWLGARDVERAMTAAWRAAAAAGASFAYAEQLMMAEQVLRLWDQVPDPAGHTGTDHVGVLMLGADAARWSGQPERGLALVEIALMETTLTEVAGDEQRRLGLARQIAAPIAGNLAESLTSAGRWDEAVEILDEVLSLDLPPLGRSHPLAVRAQIAMARGQDEIAARALEQLRALPAGADRAAGQAGADSAGQRGPRRSGGRGTVRPDRTRAGGPAAGGGRVR